MVRKGDMIEVEIEKFVYPKKAKGVYEGRKVLLEAAYPGQICRCKVIKQNEERIQGRKVEVLQPAPYECEAPCPIFHLCGGCSFQTLPYEKQLEFKEAYVLRLLNEASLDTDKIKGITGSPWDFRYRNKMEYTFGDMEKDGPLTVGLHTKKGRNDIITTDQCHLVHEDYNVILEAILTYFKSLGTPRYKVLERTGFQRNVVIRSGINTREILVNVVTRSPELCERAEVFDGEVLKDLLLALEKEGRLENKLVGILHTINDNFSDSVICDHCHILHGQDFYTETLLDLTFKVGAFSFFQPNPKAMENLYGYMIQLLDSVDMDMTGKTFFDLYCGTGAITQILGTKAKRAIGVELVEEAVEAARINTQANGLTQCDYYCGDVFEVLDAHLTDDQPDFIIVDPPRVGILPKALDKIMGYGVPYMLYVSCNPKSLAENLKQLKTGGYEVVEGQIFDNFPQTKHVETVVLMSRVDK